MRKFFAKKRKFSIILLVGLLVLLGYFCAYLVRINVQIKDQNASNNALQSKVEEQQAENDELQALLEREDKDAYIERVAREEYGYAAADERVYYASDIS